MSDIYFVPVEGKHHNTHNVFVDSDSESDSDDDSISAPLSTLPSNNFCCVEFIANANDHHKPTSSQY